MSDPIGEVCSALAVSCIEVFAGICFDIASIRHSCLQCIWPYSSCFCCPRGCCSCGENPSVGPVHLPDDPHVEQEANVRSTQPAPRIAPEYSGAPVG